MLAYFLAIAIALVSVNLYLTAFIRPKIHRRDDFLWSALGLFYGLTLWVCAGRITGAVLLGQLAIGSVAIAFIWENGKLRKAWREDETNTLEGFSVLSLILSIFAKTPKLGKKKKATKTTPQKVVEKTTEDNQKSAEEDLSPQVDEATPSSPVIEKTTQEDVTQETNQEEENQETEGIKEEKIVISQDISSVTDEDADGNLEETQISDSTADNPVTPTQQEKKGLFAKMKSTVGGIFKGKSKPVTPETTTPGNDDWMDSPDDTSDSNAQEVNEVTTETSENNLTVEEDSLEENIEQQIVNNNENNQLNDIEQLSDNNQIDGETEEEEKPAEVILESSTLENLGDEQQIVNQESEVEEETTNTEEFNSEIPPAEDTIESLTQLSETDVEENIGDVTPDDISPNKEESEIMEDIDNILEDWDKQEGKEGKES